METINVSIIIVALLAVSEALALIPKVRANSVFQMIWNLLKTMVNVNKKK